MAGRSRASRRAVAGSLLRTGVVLTALVTLYYLLPLTGVSDAGAFAVLLLCLAGVAVLTTWQVRAVVRSTRPWLRAAQALSTGLALILLGFAAVYVVLERTDAVDFTEPLDHTAALYFALTLFATVGFGDIAPVSAPARVVVMIQVLVDLAAVGIGAKVIFGAAQVSVRRRSGNTTDEPGHNE